MVRRPTIVFFPEGAQGPTNNCAGIASVLRDRGARIVFVVEESFAGTLEARGFEEALMRLKPAPAQPEAPGQFWKDFIRDTAPEFRRPTIEQIGTLTTPIWQELVDGSIYVDDRLTGILEEVRPDVIVQDNVVAFPAVPASGIPWVRIVSCNPLEVRDPDLPPAYSGYPTGDRTGWAEFRERYEATTAELRGRLDEFCVEAGAPRLPAGGFIHESPWLNLYVYPAELDYRRSVPLGASWARLESCVRQEGTFELPDELAGDGPLVYLSLGSLGSADVDLMNCLIGALAGAPYRVIVSTGPQHDRIELAGNMWGEPFLPQPSVLPLADVAITHGGNNTVTECLHLGVPMVALPLFWDQHDNAQRIDETGFGVRLAPYGFEPAELTGAIDRLLADRALGERLRRISARLQAEPGTVRAAGLIERLARREG